MRDRGTSTSENFANPVLRESLVHSHFKGSTLESLTWVRRFLRYFEREIDFEEAELEYSDCTGL